MDAALLAIPPHARATVQAILDEARRLSPDGVSYDAGILIARFGDLKRAQAQRAGTLGQFEDMDWGAIGSALLPALIGVGSRWANSAINAHAAGSTSNVDMNAIAAMMSPAYVPSPAAAPAPAPTYIVAPAAPAKDYTPWYIGGGLGALALIGGAFALAMGGGGRLRRNPAKRYPTSKRPGDVTYSAQWSGSTGAPIARGLACERCGKAVHREGDALYCPWCDAYVRGRKT